MQLLADLWRSVWRHPVKTVGLIYLAFSSLFTLIQAVNFFDSKIKFEGIIFLFGLIAVSLIFSLWMIWKPSTVDIAIKHTNTTIKISFGDIFSCPGLKLISVNNFFDSSIGRPVSDRSLHGIFINRAFGGHPQSLDSQLDQQLATVAFEEVSEKIEGKNKAYAIGTTAAIDVSGDKYILFALTKSDPATCKANSDVTLMWVALHGAWQRARIEAGGHDVNIPLVGSGLAGLGLPTRDLLNLIILSAITETKASEITRTIRIVIHRERYDEVDLRDLRKHWEND